MSDMSAADRWQDERTTFQRVYDVLVGSQSFLTAQGFADRAECSETAARNALEQLAEMGIAGRRDGRPVRYRRNDSSSAMRSSSRSWSSSGLCSCASDSTRFHRKYESFRR